MTRFRNDPACKAFLSTDAGGVGLNLQVASAVVNFEPPWNPARLEQRIGRVHRLGQAQPVQVIHLLTEDSIEERVWETLRLKKALFSGLFDSTTDEVSFEKLGRKSMMQVVKEVFCDQAGRPMPVSAAQARAAGGVEEAEWSRTAEPLPVSIPVPPVEGVALAGVAASRAGAEGGGASADSHPRPLVPEPAEAAAKLLEAGLNFLESIAPPRADVAGPTVGFEPIKRGLSALFRTDSKTQRPTLTIPLPETFSAERLAGVISGLLGKFAGSA
jgi:hypothetical protein